MQKLTKMAETSEKSERNRKKYGKKDEKVWLNEEKATDIYL